MGGGRRLAASKASEASEAPWSSGPTEAAGATGTGTLPVLPALRELLPRGGLARGSVVTVAEFGLLALALAAGASADGAWCGIAGVPEAGVLAAAALGLDTERTLLVPDPGRAWPQVVASLLDGCELVLLRRKIPFHVANARQRGGLPARRLVLVDDHRSYPLVKIVPAQQTRDYAEFSAHALGEIKAASAP